MNQVELDDYITLFLSCHKAFRIVYPDEFMAKHRYDIRFPPKKMAQVTDEYGNLEFLVYFNDDSFPLVLMNYFFFFFVFFFLYFTFSLGRYSI